MAESVTSFFTEPADFSDALTQAGLRGLLITGHGQFRARLTWVALEVLRLSAGEESLSRIAFATVPEHKVLVALRSGTHPSPIWGGMVIPTDEIVTFGPGSRVHMRTGSACRWATILAEARDLGRYGRSLVGDSFAVPTRIKRWRLPRAAGRLLRSLHAAAVREVERGHAQFMGREAAHGLDQQILSALVECLSRGSIVAEAAVTLRYQDIMVQFEAVLDERRAEYPRTTNISAALGVSPAVLRRCCQLHLGMSPGSYLSLRAI